MGNGPACPTAPQFACSREAAWSCSSHRSLMFRAASNHGWIRRFCHARNPSTHGRSSRAVRSGAVHRSAVVRQSRYFFIIVSARLGVRLNQANPQQSAVFSKRRRPAATSSRRSGDGRGVARQFSGLVVEGLGGPCLDVQRHAGPLIRDTARLCGSPGGKDTPQQPVQIPVFSVRPDPARM